LLSFLDIRCSAFTFGKTMHNLINEIESALVQQFPQDIKHLYLST
jgi:hypothetical protein